MIFPLLAAHFARENRRGRPAQPGDGTADGQLHHHPGDVRADRTRAPDRRDALSARRVSGKRDRTCAGLLPFAAAALVPLAASIVLTRCCFACKETRSTGRHLGRHGHMNVALSIMWLQPLGARGLLLANALSQMVQALLLFALVWRLVGKIDWRTLMRSALLVSVCSCVMVGVLAWIGPWGCTLRRTSAGGPVFGRAAGDRRRSCFWR